VLQPSCRCQHAKKLLMRYLFAFITKISEEGDFYFIVFLSKCKLIR